TELFENLTLMGYNITQNQKLTFQKGQCSHQWKYLIHTIMQCLSPKSTGFKEFSSNIATALVCLATNRTYNFSKIIFDGMVKNVNNKISKFLMYPRFLTICLRMSQFGQITHTHQYVVPFHTKKLFTTLRVNNPSFSGRIVPLFDTMHAHQGEGSGTPTEPHHTPSPEANTSHPTTSSILLPFIPTAPIPHVTQPDTTPIRQHSRRARIAQSSTLPTVADKPASPVRDVSEGEACPTESGFIADQDRATIAKTSTLPYDSAPRVTSPTADEGSMQHTISELTTLCTILQRQHSELLAKFQAQEVEILRFKERVQVLEDREGVATKQSRDDALIKGRNINEGEATTERISNDLDHLARVLTSMDAATVLAGGIDVPTGSGFIPTAGPPTTVISTSSEKGKEVMVESDTPKKQRLQEQIDAQVSRDLEVQQEKEDMRMNEQIARDAEVVRIHAEEELQGMIDSLDKSNETIAKKQVEDFIPMGSKEEDERLKRKGLNLEQEHVKKQKSSEQAPEMEKSSEEITEEKIKEMMQLVPVEDVYVQALQVKHPIIDWKVHTEGQRSYWQIIRLGGSSACYQSFIDLLKQLDREDLNQLWDLVKEYLSIRPAISEKEMELWVELKKLYEPDREDQLWTLTQNFMDAPVELKLYDLSGVHHLTAKDKEIFMLVEKRLSSQKGFNTCDD
nr:hypothetical protein [Tanacetum cinerariifolium]